jgi:hypothetical protein
MAQGEGDLMGKVMLGATKLGHRLWRNNRGVAFTKSGHAVAYGVGPNGASDLIGLSSIVVTPDMVGTRLAVFTAVEAKTGQLVPDSNQRAFLSTVRLLGGIALWGTDAQAILADLPRRVADGYPDLRAERLRGRTESVADRAGGAKRRGSASA